MLLELTEIQTRLDEQFLPLEPMLTGFRLVTSPVTQADVERMERQLGVVFPVACSSLVRRFDFGRFTIGPMQFGYSGDFLAEVVEMNQEGEADGNCWWGGGARPRDLLLIAGSDPNSLLLNCRTGTVSALQNWEPWPAGEIVVAQDFERLLRGLGTAFLQRNPAGGNAELADEVSRDVGVGEENSFWRWLAE